MVTPISRSNQHQSGETRVALQSILKTPKYRKSSGVKSVPQRAADPKLTPHYSSELLDKVARQVTRDFAQRLQGPDTKRVPYQGQFRTEEKTVYKQKSLGPKALKELLKAHVTLQAEPAISKANSENDQRKKANLQAGLLQALKEIDNPRRYAGSGMRNLTRLAEASSRHIVLKSDTFAEVSFGDPKQAFATVTVSVAETRDGQVSTNYETTSTKRTKSEADALWGAVTESEPSKNRINWSDDVSGRERTIGQPRLKRTADVRHPKTEENSDVTGSGDSSSTSPKNEDALAPMFPESDHDPAAQSIIGASYDAETALSDRDIDPAEQSIIGGSLYEDPVTEGFHAANLHLAQTFSELTRSPKPVSLAPEPVPLPTTAQRKHLSADQSWYPRFSGETSLIGILEREYPTVSTLLYFDSEEEKSDINSVARAYSVNIQVIDEDGTSSIHGTADGEPAIVLAKRGDHYLQRKEFVSETIEL